MTAGRPFPTTHWSVFAALGGGEETARRTALQTLAGAYWRPIYGFVRARWSDSDDEARDLTQDFFLWVMETDFLSRADPGRGRFRSFVKVALKHYLSNAVRKDRTLKRGGAAAFVPLDSAECAAVARRSATRDQDPERILDELWTADLIRCATRQLEDDCARDGKPTVFAVFKDYYLDDAQDLDYKAAAAKHGISVTDVSNHLMNAKRRFRGLLHRLVSDTVADARDLETEMRELFGEERP